MKRFAVLIMLIFQLLFCISCGAKQNIDYLEYQNSGLLINAVFKINDESFTATIDLNAPEYSDDGRMLARKAKLFLEGNSIISGVSFEFDSGTAYVVSGVLKIPVDNADMLSGINDILSLFCIDRESFYEAEKFVLDGKSCTRAIYTSRTVDAPSVNRVDVYLDTETRLPIKIEASLGEKTISANINEIKVK
jgi:hypothetical protein